MQVEICSLKRVTETQAVRIPCLADYLIPLLQVRMCICHSLTRQIASSTFFLKKKKIQKEKMFNDRFIDVS